MQSTHDSVLVVGGGMAGITAALESADLGREVYLVERSASLGGRVAGMKHYFPKLCPPLCGLEINYRRLRDNPRVTVLTSATVTRIEGTRGDFTATVEVQPRLARDVEVPFEAAYPYQTVSDPAALPDAQLRERLALLPPVAAEAPRTLTLKVGGVVWATGWKPYDAARISYLRYGQYADVLTSLDFERLAAPTGPTHGALKRPSDGRAPKRVAFIQCAGSRDEAHLPYCSAVCCMASLKQATYVREADAEAEVWIFYIDIRANRYESFYRQIQADPKVHFIKGKPGAVERDETSGDLIVVSEDGEQGQAVRVPVDLVVLATGIVPQTKDEQVPWAGLTYDEHGFLVAAPNGLGIVPAGCTKRPADVAATVQDATGASLRVFRA